MIELYVSVQLEFGQARLVDEFLARLGVAREPVGKEVRPASLHFSAATRSRRRAIRD